MYPSVLACVNRPKSLAIGEPLCPTCAFSKTSSRSSVLCVHVLFQAIPESLLTDRQAITWQSQDGASGSGGGTSMTALAVPQAVQDQVCMYKQMTK